VKVSLVTPVYNDVDALEEIIHRLACAFSGKEITLQFIVVDDGSEPSVWERLKRLSRDHLFESMVLIKLSGNHGQQLATMQGLLVADGDYLVTMDSDLQQAPEDVLRLLDEAVKGYEIVYGCYDSAHGLLRRILSRGCRILTAPIGSSLYYATSFRCIERGAFDRCIRPHHLSVISVDEACGAWLRSVSRVFVLHRSRKYNQTSHTMAALFRQVAKAFLYTRHLPRGLMVTGLGILSLSLLMLDSCGSVHCSPASWMVLLSGAGVFAIGAILKFPWRFREPGRKVRVSEVLRC